MDGAMNFGRGHIRFHAGILRVAVLGFAAFVLSNCSSGETGADIAPNGLCPYSVGLGSSIYTIGRGGTESITISWEIQGELTESFIELQAELGPQQFFSIPINLVDNGPIDCPECLHTYSGTFQNAFGVSMQAQQISVRASGLTWVNCGSIVSAATSLTLQ